MTSTTKINIYTIRFSDGSEMKIEADTVKTSIDTASTPSASVTTTVLAFELDGVVVAKYKLSDVSGWRIVQSLPKP